MAELNESRGSTASVSWDWVVIDVERFHPEQQRG